MPDRSYINHWNWWLRAESVPERWIGSAIAYEDQPDEVTRADMCTRGWGPDDAAAYPQRVESLTAGRTMPAYQRLLNKARADAERISEETRLERYVATHRPTDDELAAIVRMIRRRQHDHSSTNHDNGHQRNDGHHGQGRTCSA